MTEQPLHEMANNLHMIDLRIDNCEEMLDDGKVISVLNTLKDIQKVIHDVQFEIREKALRDEGEMEV